MQLFFFRTTFKATEKTERFLFSLFLLTCVRRVAQVSRSEQNLITLLINFSVNLRAFELREKIPKEADIKDLKKCAISFSAKLLNWLFSVSDFSLNVRYFL